MKLTDMNQFLEPQSGSDTFIMDTETQTRTPEIRTGFCYDCDQESCSGLLPPAFVMCPLSAGRDTDAVHGPVQKQDGGSLNRAVPGQAAPCRCAVSHVES